jgi:thiamine-phosphate pyrophosphorylase
MTRSKDRARLRGLYAITPQTRDTRDLVARVEQALAGGAALIQYRAKDLPAALALEQARELARACRAAGVPLIVNDSVDLAVEAGADGVHLGREDPGVERARAAFPGAIIGVSCYDDPELARAGARAGADYVAIGSVFASSTKPHARHARLETLAVAKRVSGLPVAAIGGINAANAKSALDAGADMLAVIAAVFDAPDVAAASRALAQLFNAPSHVRTQPRAV